MAKRYRAERSNSRSNSRFAAADVSADAAVQVALLKTIGACRRTFEEIGIATPTCRSWSVENPIFAGDARFPQSFPSGTDIGNVDRAGVFSILLVIPLRKKVAAAQLMKTKLRVGDAILKNRG